MNQFRNIIRPLYSASYSFCKVFLVCLDSSILFISRFISLILECPLFSSYLDCSSDSDERLLGYELLMFLFIFLFSFSCSYKYEMWLVLYSKSSINMFFVFKSLVWAVGFNYTSSLSFKYVLSSLLSYLDSNISFYVFLFFTIYS